MKAIILAAGFATRLYPLTRNKAKALLPVGGRLMVDYIIDAVLEIPAIDEVIIVSNHLFYNDFKQYADNLKNIKSTKIGIKVIDDGVYEEKNKLGAIGDIEMALNTCNIDSDVLILASDNYFDFSLVPIYEYFSKNGDVIVGTKIDDKDALKRFAVVKTDKNMRVISMEEKPKNPQSDLAAFAIYFYKKNTLHMIREYLDEGGNSDAPGNFPAWLYKRKPLYFYKFNGRCDDIGTIESYENVKEKGFNNGVN